MAFAWISLRRRSSPIMGMDPDLLVAFILAFFWLCGIKAAIFPFLLAPSVVSLRLRYRHCFSAVAVVNPGIFGRNYYRFGARLPTRVLGSRPLLWWQRLSPYIGSIIVRTKHIKRRLTYLRSVICRLLFSPALMTPVWSAA